MFAKRTLWVKESLDHGCREICFHNLRTEEQEFVNRLLNTSIVSSLRNRDCSERETKYFDER